MITFDVEKFYIDHKSEELYSITFCNLKMELRFTLTYKELVHVLFHDINVYYNDLSRFIQFNKTYISYMIICGNNAENYEIKIRFDEFKFFLKKLLSLNVSEDRIDCTEDFLKAMDLAKPRINVSYYKCQNLIEENTQINNYVQNVISIANNRSMGQDDLLDVTFFLENNKKDIYFSIMRKNALVLNGGIIYDERNNSYGMHT